jgi:hypothetical protein
VAAEASTIPGDPPQTFLIRPGASWKPSQATDSFVDSLAAIDLTRVNGGLPVAAGRILEVRARGRFDFDSQGNLSDGATGLLVSSAGTPVAPGIGSTVGPTVTANECGLTSGADAFPDDFLIPNDSPATVVVPSGAVSLRLSVVDCFYRDNRVFPGDPIRVTVTLRP